MAELATGEGEDRADVTSACSDDVVAAVLALTEQLSAANSHEDVARIVATSGIEHLGASAGFVAIASVDGSALEMRSHVRSDEPATPLCTLDTEERLPVVDAWRFGVPVLARDAEELYGRYPTMDRSRPDRAAVAALPLEVDGVLLGAINLTWATPQRFDEPQLRVLRIVAGLCAQALRRARLALEVEQVHRDFAITAAHELRSPLTAIYAAAVTLADPSERPAHARGQLVDVIVSQAERLAQLIERLDLAAELDAGTTELDVVPVDVASVVAEAIALQAHQGRDVARVQPRIHDELSPVLADRARLLQVLLQLVDNACRYAPADTAVEVEAFARGAAIDLRVLDRGPGLAERDRERVFEKFFRTDAMQRNGVSGIGLGLFVSRRLVEAMHGTIWLEPRADGVPGLAACVRLPAAPA